MTTENHHGGDNTGSIYSVSTRVVQPKVRAEDKVAIPDASLVKSILKQPKILKKRTRISRFLRSKNKITAWRSKSDGSSQNNGSDTSSNSLTIDSISYESDSLGSNRKVMSIRSADIYRKLDTEESNSYGIKLIEREKQIDASDHLLHNNKSWSKYHSADNLIKPNITGFESSNGFIYNINIGKNDMKGSVPFFIENVSDSFTKIHAYSFDESDGSINNTKTPLLKSYSDDLQSIIQRNMKTKENRCKVNSVGDFHKEKK